MPFYNRRTERNVSNGAGRVGGRAPAWRCYALETLGLMINPLSRELLPMRMMLARLGARSSGTSMPEPNGTDVVPSEDKIPLLDSI